LEITRMRHFRFVLTLAKTLPLVIVSACGGTTITETAPDSGAPDVRVSDVSTRPDVAPDATGPVDAKTSDAVDAGSRGTLLTPGKDLVLWGVTSDGFAVYSVAKENPVVYAVSLEGGAPTEIDTLATEYSYALVQGNVVAVLNDVASTGAGTIKLWTSTGGLHTISSTAYTYEFFLSPGLQQVAYLDDFDATLGTADLYVSQSDGTAATLLEAAVAGISNTSACYPQVGFAGSSVVLGYCPTPGSMTGNIYSFAEPSWAPTTVVSGGYPYFISDPTGTNLLIFASGLQVIPVAGGTATTIDPNGMSAAFTSDGANVVYASSSGALMRSPIASPSPAVLVSGGVEGIYELSPDNSTALVFKSYDSMTYLSDLYAASAVTSGALTTLSMAETASVASPEQSGLVNGAAFTADSSHVLFYSGVSTASYPYLGTLEVSTPSGPPLALATNSNTALPTGASTVVFEDNFALLAGMTVGTIDIKAIDTQAGGSPTLLVGGGNASSYGSSFYLSKDGSRVVYTQNATKTTQAGLFVTPVP
jgi:hypothetical protein